MSGVPGVEGDTLVQVIGASIGIVLLALALLHVYWASGGTYGSDAAIPERPASTRSGGQPVMVKAFQPSRTGTLLVAAGLAIAATMTSLRSGLLGPPVVHWSLDWAVTAIAILMLARAVGDFALVGFFKAVKGSAFARRDTLLHSPLRLLLGLGLGFIAWS